MAGEGQIVGKIGIRVSPRTDRFRQELRAQLEKIEKSIEAAIDVEPNLRGFREKIKAATSNLPDAKVGVDVDRSMLSRLRESIGAQLSKINIPDPKFSGFNMAGLGLAGLVGVLATAGPLVGLLTTSLAAIPGLLAAVAAPIGAITLGLDGIKAAASRLAAPFEALKATMSEFTERQFAPVFDRLLGIFPMLTRALPNVSQGVADLARAFVDSVTSSAGMSKIEESIGNIAKALSAAAPGIASFTDGLLGLAQGFTQKLPGIAEWFNTVGKSFSDWVTRISTDGSLSKAFEGLGATLKTIGEAIVPLLGKGLDFMSDPEAVSKFNTALQGIGTALNSIMNDSIALYGVFQDLKGVFTEFDFSGIWADLTGPFTSQDAPWREYAASISEAFNSIRANVATAMSGVVQTVSGVVSQISGVWNGVVSAAQAAWNAVVSTVTTAIANAVAAVVSGGGQILAEVGSWPGRIASAVGNMGGILVAAGKSLMDGLLAGIKSGLQAVLDFASGIADKIAAVKGPLPYDRRVLEPAGIALMDGLQTGIENGMKSVLESTRGIAGQIAQEINPDLVTKDWQQFDPKQFYDIPADFAKSVGGQFMSDLGIGGNGAISQAVQQGLGFAEQFIFNVGSMDEALGGQQRIQNKKSLSYTQR